MTYWEAIARMSLAEDDLRDAREELGAGELAKAASCVGHATFTLQKVIEALEKRQIEHVSLT